MPPRPLPPCPATPNCVSTMDAAPSQRMEPVPFRCSPAEAVAAVLTLLRSLPRVRIVEADETLVYAVFVSRVFRFRDDVHFTIDADAKLIHFRSASRLGRYDFGVNRRRMTALAAHLRSLVR